MKLKSLLKILSGLLLVAGFAVACEKDLPEDEQKDPVPEPPVEQPVESGISNVNNSYAEKDVSYMGATISVKMDLSAAWSASLVLLDAPEKEWAAISKSTQSGAAKKGATVRIVFEENNDSAPRSAELWVAVEGFEPERVAVLKQAASGMNADAKINEALNSYMHEILKEDYLFRDAYNAQEIDLKVPYSEFLGRHLLSLGDVNVEDGGLLQGDPAESGREVYIYKYS